MHVSSDHSQHLLNCKSEQIKLSFALHCKYRTLGVANVGGMCRPDRSCSVNEDNGITLAHTITHELGHNFGMYHDTEKTGCDRRAGSIVHVMTPSFEADTIQVSWSNCSRRYITHFLELVFISN